MRKTQMLGVKVGREGQGVVLWGTLRKIGLRIPKGFLAGSLSAASENMRRAETVVKNKWL